MTTRIQQFPFGPGVGGGGLDNVVEDLTPELGGDLLTNGFAIRGSDPSGADSGDLTLQTAGPDSTFNSGKVRIGSGFVSGGGVAGDTEFVHGNGVFFRHTKNGVFGIFQGEATAGPAMQNVTASPTVPSFIIRKDALTTGIGGAPSDVLILIGQGQEFIRVDGDNNELTFANFPTGFFGNLPVSRPAVIGSRGGNAALASLLTGLNSLGLVTDSSSA